MMGKQPIEMELGLPNNCYSWLRFQLAECLLVSYYMTYFRRLSLTIVSGVV